VPSEWRPLLERGDWWRRRERCPAAGHCSVAWRELDVFDLLASTSPRHDRRVMREGDQARASPEYAPRRPETTNLYRVVQHRLEAWLGNARTRERTVPRFVERELTADPIAEEPQVLRLPQYESVNVAVIAVRRDCVPRALPADERSVPVNARVGGSGRAEQVRRRRGGRWARRSGVLATATPGRNRIAWLKES